MPVSGAERITLPKGKAGRLAVMLLAAMCATTVHADALGDLRATLARLQGSAPVAGTLTITQQTRDGEGAKARRSEATLTLDVASARGLRIHVPAPVLATAARERAAAQADPERPTPTADLLAAIGSVQVLRMLDVAANLQLSLADAKLLKDTPTTLDGAPAQELTFDLPLRVSKSDRSKVKHYRSTLSLWLSPQGTPLAYITNTDTEAGWLFLDFTMKRNESVRLAVTDGRLIATRLDLDQQTSGLGQHGATRTTYVMDLQTVPAAAQAVPAQGTAR